MRASIFSRRQILKATIGGIALIGPLAVACAPATAPPGVTSSSAPPAATPTTAAAAAGAGSATPTAAAAASGASSATPTSAPAKPAAGVTPSATPEPFREAKTGRAKTVEVWTTWGGTSFPNMVKVVEAFEELHPDVGVRVAFEGGYPQNEAKLLTAVAGGKPPDVAFVDGTQVSSWAVAGGLQPLNDKFKTAKIQSDDYWAPSWKQNIWKGNIYALTLGSDPNFGFFWNKSTFKDAGLDPEKPPETIAQVDEFQAKLFKQEGNTISRMGIIPWTVYGNGNSMYTWGWVFGGEFYNEDSGKVTADHELNVKSLEWIVDNYAKKYDITRISGFQAGFGTGENSPFFVGKTGMAPLGPWELTNIKRFAPKLEFGITFMPTGPAPAVPHSTWVGGWCEAIPVGAKNPDDGWQFIDFMCHSDQGTSLLGTLQGNFPGYKKSPYYTDVVDKDPQLKIFLDILKEARHQRPVIPVQAFYWQELGRALDNAIFGKQTPKEALAEVTKTTQKELDQALARS